MTQTTLTDFAALIPETYGPLLQANIAKFVDFLSLGMMDRVNLPAGEYVPFPGFKELGGEMEVMGDNTGATIGKIDPKKDLAVILHRMKAFGADDLVRIVTGLDPNAEIARQLGMYVAKKVMENVLRVLVGSCGAALSANVHDVFVDDSNVANQKRLSAEVAAAGMAKLGDELFKLAGWVMHSKVYADLLAAGYVSVSMNTSGIAVSEMGEVSRFMGKPIVVRDSVNTHSTPGVNAPLFRTFGIGMGALAYGVQQDANPEQDRDKLKKSNFVNVDIHYSPHLRGVAWVPANGGPNPADAALLVPANYVLAAESAKYVPVIAIDHN